MPTLPSRRLGALRLVLMGAVLALVPAGAEAFTTRIPRGATGWHGHHAQRTMPGRVAKRVPAKVQAKAVPVEAPKDAAASGKPAERNGTWTAGDGGRACFRSRRKLWQADEGWIVKKVNVCP